MSYDGALAKDKRGPGSLSASVISSVPPNGLKMQRYAYLFLVIDHTYNIEIFWGRGRIAQPNRFKPLVEEVICVPMLGV